MADFDDVSPVTAKKPAPLGMKRSGGCCCEGSTATPAHEGTPTGWERRYFFTSAAIAVAWLCAYLAMEPLARWVIFTLCGVTETSHLGQSLEFFLYDTAKILLLLFALIYVIAWLRAALNVERVREYLAGKRRLLGYFLGALFGSVTPFCSCSSIPLFLGFTTARIPFVIFSMGFLLGKRKAIWNSRGLIR